MKILCNSALLVLALGTVLTYSSCDNGGGTDPTVEEVQLEKLTGTWGVAGTGTNVTLDGVSQKTDYTNFKLILAGTPGNDEFGYSTESRPAKLNPWPSSGNWGFGVNPEATIVRDPNKATDVLEMSYTVSDTHLELTFTFMGTGYSRTSKVTGTWVFTLAKQ
jgi:hypothetical protein